MKIGIVTITELDNFGNRLQNYALQTVLENMGAEVETLHNYINYKSRRSLLSKAIRYAKGRLKRDFRRAEVVKQLRFEAFDKQYFKFSHGWSTIDAISDGLDAQYDCFVAGSDQIWNPYFAFNWDFNFLRFAAPEKRIAYAASFGVDDVPQEQQKNFREGIGGFRAISTREYSGSALVKTLTGREAQVLPDPTLLLTPEEWAAMEKKPGWHSAENYCLVYHLGTAENQKSVLDRLLESHPEYRGLGIINVGDPMNVHAFSVTPDEFLYLVHHAKLMVTDSFHGSVFSFLFGIPLYYTKRVDDYRPMNARFESLIKMLEIAPAEIITSHKDDRRTFEKVLEAQRNRGFSYLQSNIFDFSQIAEESKQ